jgi:16S rRNA processing protein RimM
VADPEPERLVTAGRVGKAHGLDGSFRVTSPDHPLAPGTTVIVAGDRYRVSRRKGSDDSPILALEGVTTREAAVALGGELLLVTESNSPLEDGEWLAADLVGCRIEGIGTVERVIASPSCDVLEISDGSLIPLIADAVTAIDTGAGTVQVDYGFLGREPPE